MSTGRFIHTNKNDANNLIELIKITPSYNIFGKNIDIDTLIIFISSIVILILLIGLLFYLK